MARLVIEAALIAAGGILMAADLRAMFPGLSEKGERRVKILGMVVFIGALFAMVFEVIVLVAGPVLSLALRVLVSLIGAALAAGFLYALSRGVGWLMRRVVEWAGRGRLDLPYGFRAVWIGNIVNERLESLYANPPMGRCFLGGIWFEIHAGDPTKGINNTLHTEEGREYTVDLPRAVRGVRALYFLVNSTNTYERDRGTLMGQIVLVFHKGRLNVPLVIGENVREWCIGHSGTLSRSTDPRLREVWRVPTIRSPHVEAVIDVLKIEVPTEYRSQSLERIGIADGGVGGHRLLMSGITCLVEI